MKALTVETIQFFHKQNFVIVSSLDKDSTPHNSCKDIVKIGKNGRIYLLDLYKGKTFQNLKRDPRIAITAVDEHRFKGYCLKGKAKIVKREKISSHVITIWEEKIVRRITHRVLKNIGGEKGHSRHPEVLLPKPEYLIDMRVERVIDLTPHHIKRKGGAQK